MGWTVTFKSPSINTVEYLIGELERSSELVQHHVRSAAAVKDTVYAAVEHVDKLTHLSYVFAVVILTETYDDRIDDLNFGFKELDETAGPYYYDCPANILDLLSPTNNEQAMNRRATCRIQLSRRQAIRQKMQHLVVGNSVRFDPAIVTKHYGAFTDLILLDKRRWVFAVSHQPQLRIKVGRELMLRGEYDVIGVSAPGTETIQRQLPL